jgi:protein ImuA
MAEAGRLAELFARGDVWVGDSLAVDDGQGIPTGWPALDAELPGGGWPSGALVDVLDGDGGLSGASLFVPALARLTQAGQWCALLQPVESPWQPCAPGWAAAGVDLGYLMIVTASTREQPWACEQILRAASVRLLLAALPAATPAIMRRLQLAAAAGAATGAIFRGPETAAQAAAAPLRLHCAVVPAGLAVHILKRRGAPLAHPLSLPMARPQRIFAGPAAPARQEPPHAMAGAGLSAVATRCAVPPSAACSRR